MAIILFSMFPFSACKDWVEVHANRLKEKGCTVEVIVNSEHLPTIAVKVMSGALIADLVVWEYGRCSMQVFDLKRGLFTLQSHDVELASDSYTSQIQRFFDLISEST
jgi:hypothetical protein